MNYIQNLILSDEDYKWSYSRVSKYSDCKYAWFLKYIEDAETEELFFSQFGKFVHKIYAEILLGNLAKENAVEYFLANYRREVTAKAPTDKTFSSYFNSGLAAMKNVDEFLNEIKDYEIVGVEIPVEFEVCGAKFVGIIDLLLKDKDENYIIVDHKSRTLKPRSKKRTLKSDKELDEYLEQLYLYADAVNEIYGKYPTELWFHCYRNTDNKIIKEKYSDDTAVAVEFKTFAQIEEIKMNETWTPNCDWFSCTNLCECHGECEYYQAMFK